MEEGKYTIKDLQSMLRVDLTTIRNWLNKAGVTTPRGKLYTQYHLNILKAKNPTDTLEYYGNNPQVEESPPEGLDIRKVRYQVSSKIRKVRSENRKNKAQRYSYRGDSKSIAEWADEIGIHKSTIYARIQSGWDVHKALTTPASQVGGKGKKIRYGRR